MYRFSPLFFTFLLAACAQAGPPTIPSSGQQPSAAEQQPVSGGELTFVVGSEPPSFDGHKETTFAMVHPTAPHYSVLVRFSQDQFPNIEGDAAETDPAEPGDAEPADTGDGDTLVKTSIRRRWPVFRPRGRVIPRRAIDSHCDRPRGSSRRVPSLAPVGRSLRGLPVSGSGLPFTELLRTKSGPSVNGEATAYWATVSGPSNTVRLMTSDLA